MLIVDLHSRTERKIAAVEMRCFRRTLGISYTDHVTNEEICKTLVQHVGHCEDLLTTVNKRELRWYGHVTRSSGLSKTTLQGKLQGNRRRGVQRKRWTDDMEEWTGKTFAETQAVAHKRPDWSRLVQRSWVKRPYDPGGLRDQ